MAFKNENHHNKNNIWKRVMKVVTAYYPDKKFPALSVTGQECRQQCKHCKGKFLKGMMPVSPENIVLTAEKLYSQGAEGFLLSGGCDGNGRVEIMPFLNAIKRIKAETDLKINIHTGFLNRTEALELMAAEIDSFSIDIVQDKNVIRNCLNLDVSPNAYKETLEGAVKIVPHVCIGLQSAEGEMESLKLISKFKVSSVVVLGLIPARGMKSSVERMPLFISEAVKTKKPITIGCMRPRGNTSLDIECIKAGASAIAVPSSKTIEILKEEGWTVIEKNECCSLF